MNTLPLPNFLAVLLIFGLRKVALAGPETWAPVAGVVPSGGFSVDMNNRIESLAFYNAVYLASEGASKRMGWTGAFSGSCARGTTSTVFQDDVRRRVNYYRAICGLPDVTFDADPAPNDGPAGKPQVAAGTSKHACAQAAAYMHGFSSIFFDNYIPLHDPAANVGNICYTNSAWNGAYHSNLTIGYCGPKAIDVYMADDGAGTNFEVGHRRWILFSRAKDMATGDVPAGSYTGDGTRIQPANALYVSGVFKPAEQSPKQFVTWPPKGYVPRSLIPARWSVSFPGAVFPASAAYVTLTGPDGAAIPVTFVSANQGNIGDNTFVFAPANLPLNVSGDSTYTATLTGISGSGVPVSHTWQTHFFDPFSLGLTQSVSGPAQPPRSGADYQFNAAPLAGQYQILVAQPGGSGTYVEDAESAAPDIIADKTGTYPILQGSGILDGLPFLPSGNRSLHLCFPYDRDEEDYLPHPQSFQLGSELVVASNSVLTFHEHFRWLFAQNRLSVEISADGGNRWEEIYGRNGVYTYNVGGTYNSTRWDTGWSLRTVPLGVHAGYPIRLRFILRPGKVSFDGPDIHHGCYLDNITLTNVRRLSAPSDTNIPDTNFRLNSQSAGGELKSGADYMLRVRPEIGSRFMGYSTPLTVVPARPTGFELAHPELGGVPLLDSDGDGILNILEYAFASYPSQPDPGNVIPQAVLSGTNLDVNFTVPAGVTDINYSAEWTSDFARWLPVPDTGSGARRSFSIPVIPGTSRYIRLRVDQRAP